MYMSKEQMPIDRDTMEVFSQAAGLAAFGGLVRAIKSGIGWGEAILNSIISGFFMLGIGAAMKYCGANDYIIFFTSGIIGVNANLILEWIYRLSGAFFSWIQKRFNNDNI